MVRSKRNIEGPSSSAALLIAYDKARFSHGECRMLIFYCSFYTSVFWSYYSKIPKFSSTCKIALITLKVEQDVLRVMLRKEIEGIANDVD